MKDDETGESLLQQSDEIRSHFGSRHEGDDPHSVFPSIAGLSKTPAKSVAILAQSIKAQGWPKHLRLMRTFSNY